MGKSNRLLKPILLGVAGLLILAGLGLFAAWAMTAAKPAQLVWDTPVVRKSLMSFGYKVYGNPNVAQGRYFLSKLVLKNAGGRPIRNLSVSYQIPDYISWTTPDTTTDLPGGHSTVAIYYPRFSEKVAQLDNSTTATLEIKLQWQEDGGANKEQVLRQDITIFGRNEVQYGDLPADEMLTWYDSWTLAQFIMCMVTPNDPVVKEYAAAITQKMGGTLAGVTKDQKSVLELMKATYDYMRETGMRYVSSEGVPLNIGDVQTLIQTVRMPRDVITTNSGLCIELALLWASLMTHLGCDSYVVLRPGHAFTIVEAEGQMFPIECTAITPKAVGSEEAVSFESAVKMAAEDYQKQQYKILYSVNTYKSEGYASPELAETDSDKIRTMLAAREEKSHPPPNGGQPPMVANSNQDQGGNQGQQESAPPDNGNMAHYQHRNGLVEFNYPAQWRVQQVPAGLDITFDAEDPQNNGSIQVLEIPQATNISGAMRLLSQNLSRIGAQIHVDDTRQQGTIGIVMGHTVSRNGVYKWLAVLHPVRGGVIGVAAGCIQDVFQNRRPEFEQLLGTVRFP